MQPCTHIGYIDSSHFELAYTRNGFVANITQALPSLSDPAKEYSLSYIIFIN